MTFGVHLAPLKIAPVRTAKDFGKWTTGDELRSILLICFSSSFFWVFFTVCSFYLLIALLFLLFNSSFVTIFLLFMIQDLHSVYSCLH